MNLKNPTYFGYGDGFFFFFFETLSSRAALTTERPIKKVPQEWVGAPYVQHYAARMFCALLQVPNHTVRTCSAHCPPTAPKGDMILHSPKPARPYLVVLVTRCYLVTPLTTFA